MRKRTNERKQKNAEMEMRSVLSFHFPCDNINIKQHGNRDLHEQIRSIFSIYTCSRRGRAYSITSDRKKKLFENIFITFCYYIRAL